MAGLSWRILLAIRKFVRSTWRNAVCRLANRPINRLYLQYRTLALAAPNALTDLTLVLKTPLPHITHNLRRRSYVPPLKLIGGRGPGHRAPRLAARVFANATSVVTTA